MTLTDVEVIEILAKRDERCSLVGLKKRGLWYRPNAGGYTSCECDAGKYSPDEAKKREYLRGPEYERVRIVPFSRPTYLTSRDALAPVLAGLSDEEWHRLIVRLGQTPYSPHVSRIPNASLRFEAHLLTLPPTDLARAIASVLQGREEVAK